MKTYQNEKPRNKKAIVAVVASLAVLIVALAIALPLLLTNRSNAVDSGDHEIPSSTSGVAFVSPLEQASLGKEYNVNDLLYSKTLKRWSTHKGVDFMADVGTKVKAIADGKVESVASTNLDGYVVIISHDNGLVSIYKSLGEDVSVEEGDEVNAGDVIGSVGLTMITEQADGPHLHLEMTVNGKNVNPLDYIPGNEEK